jgi:predicted phosphodiesterase
VIEPGAAPHRSRPRRVAVLSDVHGNAVAFEAVLHELADERPDLVVFGGDLTWGPLPAETLALVQALDAPTTFVRGNAERALAELESAPSPTPRERWMLEQHPAPARAFLASFVESAVVEVDGLGPVRFCHGSPRSDEELVTFATPEERVRAFMVGIPERTLVSAHTHLQFDRTVAGIRSINPGSVGMPYEGRSGLAFWAVLGPDVELRSTAYDVDEAVRRYRLTSDPSAEQMVDVLLRPPTPAEVVEHAEAREFAG